MSKQIFVILGITLFLVVSGMLSAQDDVMFNYQGRVKVQGNPFSGSGQFKFAIVNNAGNESLWSNDNTSSGGGEPISSITISVTDGIFNAMIGDTNLGMSSINRTILNHPNMIKLRIWFSDGVHGFQQLLPDHKLVNMEILGHTTGTDDFTIYVNGTTGNDNHNGLSPAKAKKTIQAAVDVLPVQLKCNVTIDIADGVYRESVYVYAIMVEYPYCLTFQGDESWTPSSPSDPTVRITGNDDDVTGIKARDFALHVNNTIYIYFKGLLLDNGKYSCALLIDGHCSFHNCKFSNGGLRGLHLADNGNANLQDCLAEYNGVYGVHVYNNSYSNIKNCIFRNNTKAGIIFYQHSCGYFNDGTGEFSNNERGILVQGLSRIYFTNTYTGQIHHNSVCGLDITYDSHTQGHTQNTFSNNGGGTVDNVHTSFGGNAY